MNFHLLKCHLKCFSCQDKCLLKYGTETVNQALWCQSEYSVPGFNGNLHAPSICVTHTDWSVVSRRTHQPLSTGTSMAYWSSHLTNTSCTWTGTCVYWRYATYNLRRQECTRLRQCRNWERPSAVLHSTLSVSTIFLEHNVSSYCLAISILWQAFRSSRDVFLFKTH